MFDQLGKAKFYHTADLKSGFHEVRMKPRDTFKTAFSIHPLGRFEFVVLPFGLVNSPRTFQRILNRVLGDPIGNTCFVFIDDIIVFGETVDETNERFYEVAQKLREAGLKLEPQKCEWLKKEVNFLGHVISEAGIKPDKKKVQAVEAFPVPKATKNVREFLGLCDYYRRFIKNVAEITKLLTILLHKHRKFFWNEEQQQAFEKLKKLLCEAPILQYPQVDQPYIVRTGASNHSLGAVLPQGELGSDRPIAYASRVLDEAERNYMTYEREALAIIFAIKTFRTYLFGNKFLVVTDHKPSLSLKSAYNNSRVQKWRLKLVDYDFDIIYRPGKENGPADCLSRNPVETKISVMTRAQKAKLDKNDGLTKSLTNDEKLKILNDQRVKKKNKRKQQHNTRNTSRTHNQRIDNSAERTDKRIHESEQNRIYSKQSIQFRNDNIVHIVSEKKG